MLILLIVVQFCGSEKIVFLLTESQFEFYQEKKTHLILAKLHDVHCMPIAAAYPSLLKHLSLHRPQIVQEALLGSADV